MIGIRDYKVDKKEMRQVIAEFFFMAAMTGRYTSSPETSFESDLGAIRDLADGEAFVLKLREIATTTLTSDYWDITLPSQLAKSASRSPSLFAYHASLIKLDANALYSDVKIASMVDPAVKGAKAAFEQHHLYPKSYLNDLGISDFKLVNQIANFAMVEWPENIQIGKKAPSVYVPPLDAALSAQQREEMYFWHALPNLWWELPYEEFLVQRRVRMAAVVKKAWVHLSGGATETTPATVTVSQLIAGGETDATEFKATLRMNLHTGQPDEKMHLAALKTIAGFLNAKGGVLLIGVADDGEILGLEADGFVNEDKMGLHLVNLVKDRLGDVFLPYIHPHFEDLDGRRVLSIHCDKGPKAAYVKDGQAQRFFVRGGNATTELFGPSIMEYCKQRFC